MADNSNITLKHSDNLLGEIRISPRVIEIIIGIAASQVEGVANLRGRVTNSFSDLFKQDRGKGVYLIQEDSGLKVDVYALLKYGVSVPKVAQEIQNKVNQQVFFMTGLKLVEVNVHIQGIVLEKSEAAVDLDNLFEEESGE